jgi:hypothetical protein
MALTDSNYISRFKVLQLTSDAWRPAVRQPHSLSFGTFQPFSSLLELCSQFQQCRFHVPQVGFFHKLQTFIGPQSILFRSRHGDPPIIFIVCGIRNTCNLFVPGLMKIADCTGISAGKEKPWQVKMYRSPRLAENLSPGAWRAPPQPTGPPLQFKLGESQTASVAGRAKPPSSLAPSLRMRSLFSTVFCSPTLPGRDRRPHDGRGTDPHSHRLFSTQGQSRRWPKLGRCSVRKNSALVATSWAGGSKDQATSPP